MKQKRNAFDTSLAKANVVDANLAVRRKTAEYSASREAYGRWSSTKHEAIANRWPCCLGLGSRIFCDGTPFGTSPVNAGFPATVEAAKQSRQKRERISRDEQV